MIKIVDRRAFAHKLGIRANAEILSLFTRFLFQHGRATLSSFIHGTGLGSVELNREEP